MKRDMNLINLLMRDMEECGIGNKDFSKYPREVIMYHEALLIEKKFVEGSVSYIEKGEKVPIRVCLYRLTWAGHDYLDAISAY